MNKQQLTLQTAKIDSFVTAISQQHDVLAVALAGSRGAQTADETSDIDLYVYATTEVPVQLRQKIILPNAKESSIGNTYFESGDEWLDADANIWFDVMYRTLSWIESEVDAVWFQHQPKLGYTTAFIYNVQHATPIHDPESWYQNLQVRVNSEYPDALQQNIIQHNFPLLRDEPASFLNQIDKAIHRKDAISVNHRLAAFVASYLDVLLAINKQLHPGEKRLISFVMEHCEQVPHHFQEFFEQMLVANHQDHSIISMLEVLVTELEEML